MTWFAWRYINSKHAHRHSIPELKKWTVEEPRRDDCARQVLTHLSLMLVSLLAARSIKPAKYGGGGGARSWEWARGWAQGAGRTPRAPFPRLATTSLALCCKSFSFQIFPGIFSCPEHALKKKKSYYTFGERGFEKIRFFRNAVLLADWLTQATAYCRQHFFFFLLKKTQTRRRKCKRALGKHFFMAETNDGRGEWIGPLTRLCKGRLKDSETRGVAGPT